MSGFDPLVERATRRLSRDRELRGEVSRELASHLAASAAEYRSAGYAEANADAAAAKDFGDPDDVADALWEANRFRVRLRAWGWWAARLTLVPACVAAACWMMLPTLATSAAMANLSQGNWVSVSPVMRWYDRRVRARMTADQRLIAFGDESAPDELARWSAVRDAHPHDPLAQLRVVEEAMVRVNSAAAGHPSPGATVETEAVRLRAELDRLDGLQPDNALVPLVRAYLDLWQVTLQDRNAPDAAVMIETLNRNAAEPARVETYIRRLAGPVDEAALAAGLAHLAEAAERPYLGTYPLSRMARRFGALPPPRTMRDHLHRMGEEIALRLPALGHYRRVNQVVCGEAIRRAEAGEVAGAIGLLDQLAAVNRKQAAGAETLIGVLVARTNAQWERATRVAVWRATGDEAKAAEALAYSDALERFWRREWVAKRADAASGKSGSGSLLVGDLASAVPGFDVDATPFRKSEYVQFDRAALLLGLVLLLGVSLLASAVSVASRWRRRRHGGGPMLLWIGWRWLGWVLGGAVALPLSGFGLWAWLPWSGRGEGLNEGFGPLVAYGPLVVWVAGGLLMLGSSALRRRAAEVGLWVPETSWRHGVEAGAWVVGLAVGLAVVLSWTLGADCEGVPWWRVVGGLSAWLFTVYVALVRSGWRVYGLSRSDVDVRRLATEVIALTAVVSAVGVGVAWAVAEVPDRTVFVFVALSVVGWLSSLLVWWRLVGSASVEGRRFGGTLMRSLAPVMVTAGLLLSVVVGGALQAREAALARTIHDDYPGLFTAEVERSQGRVIRAYLAGDAEPPPTPDWVFPVILGAPEDSSSWPTQPRFQSKARRSSSTGRSLTAARRSKAG